MWPLFLFMSETVAISQLGVCTVAHVHCITDLSDHWIIYETHHEKVTVWFSASASKTKQNKKY